MNEDKYITKYWMDWQWIPGPSGSVSQNMKNWLKMEKLNRQINVYVIFIWHI
jgi:hypothetical protein